MPVTARLLQRLQEALGEEAADDLFAWFDEAGWVNRGAVREVADLYFERFDTRLESGLASLRTEFTTRLETEVGKLRVEFTARLEQRLAETRADLIRWMFIFWAGTVVPLAGLIIALHRS